MHVIDFIVFIAFTLGVVVFGCSFFKKGSSADEFTSAGHSIPGWVVGMSIFATYVSSISYIGYPGKAFAADWNAFVFSLSIPIASYFAAKYFVPFYRPMYILMGWDMHTVIILTSIGIIIYSMMGGLKAVIWADAIQGIILIGGALLCLGILMFSMPEGPMQTFELAANSPVGNKFSLGAFTSDLTTSTFWVCLIYGIFINLQNYGIDQNYVQRYHAAKTDKDAKFSALFGGYLFIPVSALFFLIGSALYSYYQAGVAPLPAEIQAKPDYVFPYFIVNGLPVGLRGLLIASIFAAGMSTVSTSVTSAATIILTDYVRPFFLKARKVTDRLRHHDPEDHHKHQKLELAIVRFSSFGVGMLGACVAIAMLSVGCLCSHRHALRRKHHRRMVDFKQHLLWRHAGLVPLGMHPSENQSLGSLPWLCGRHLGHRLDIPCLHLEPSRHPPASLPCHRPWHHGHLPHRFPCHDAGEGKEIRNKEIKK